MLPHLHLESTPTPHSFRNYLHIDPRFQSAELAASNRRQLKECVEPLRRRHRSPLGTPRRRLIRAPCRGSSAPRWHPPRRRRPTVGSKLHWPRKERRSAPGEKKNVYRVFAVFRPAREGHDFRGIRNRLKGLTNPLPKASHGKLGRLKAVHI